MTRIDFKQPHVMAEIGCNHMGEFETAKELLTLAKEAGASVGKAPAPLTVGGLSASGEARAAAARAAAARAIGTCGRPAHTT